MVQDGYACAADIDIAMTLGCGYPQGPFQLLDSAGADAVLAGLESMHEAYGYPSFAPPPLLAEHAAAGIAFCADQNPAAAGSARTGSAGSGPVGTGSAS
jgi:3-hydroxybutyryl-CoA dehydrogenase